MIEEASNTVGDDPTALTALATAVTLLLGDSTARRYFVDRALTLDPNHAWAWTRRGFIDVYRGDAEAAIAGFERAMRLSPLDPFSFNSYIGLGLSNFALGRPDEAVQWTRRAMREKVGMTWAYRDLATFLAAAGKVDEAEGGARQAPRDAAASHRRPASPTRSASWSRASSAATSRACASPASGRRDAAAAPLLAPRNVFSRSRARPFAAVVLLLFWARWSPPGPVDRRDVERQFQTWLAQDLWPEAKKLGTTHAVFDPAAGGTHPRLDPAGAAAAGRRRRAPA